MRARLVNASLVGAMALGSLALWIGLPIGWLWLARDLEPSGTRFVVTIVGCVISMVGAGWLLFRLEGMYVEAGGTEREPDPPSWLRTNREASAPRAPLSLLEKLLVASALTAIVALVIWWAFIADSANPSGPLQPL